MTASIQNAIVSSFAEGISGLGEPHPVFRHSPVPSTLHRHIGKLYFIYEYTGSALKIIAKYFYEDNRTKYIVLTDSRGQLLPDKVRALGVFLWQSYYPSRAPQYFINAVYQAVKVFYIETLSRYQGVSFPQKYSFVNQGKNININYVPDRQTQLLKADFNRRRKKYLLSAAAVSALGSLLTMRLIS